ncbi:MAG TPA: sugar ABC transporter permease [Candidatus Dormibacteraeota bacterium]|jgi:multiple sugar transport system permease protein|nr:sugar ABC transporter permease [Candidatus Dormibacteraeota bacterium]
MAAVTSAPGRGRRRQLRVRVGEHPIGYLFVLPYVVFLAAVYAYPFAFSVYMSFYDWFFAAPGAEVERPFVGLGNYAAALADPLVHVAIRNVAIFLAINVPITVVLSLALAAALNGVVPLRAFFRGAYFVPYVTASVAVVGVWYWLFSGYGLVARLLGPLAPNPPFLVNPRWAIVMIALYVTWKQLGFYVLLYLAALQNIPRELYEAARVDGAGWWRSFLAVTVPGVRPATVLVVILAVVVGANFFTEPYLLTGGGGPDNQSISPVLLIYRYGIEQNHPGYAAAIGVLLVVGVLAVSAVHRFVLERE